MFKYDDIVNQNTNKIFTYLTISYILINTFLIDFLIKPFYIKLVIPNEDISQHLKTYYLRNYTQSLIIDYILVIFYLLASLFAFRMFNKLFNFKFELLALLIISSMVITMLNLILYIIFNKINSKKEEFTFIKKWTQISGKHGLIWSLIYNYCILFFLLFLLRFDFNPIYLIQILCILVFFKIFI